VLVEQVEIIWFQNLQLKEELVLTLFLAALLLMVEVVVVELMVKMVEQVAQVAVAVPQMELAVLHLLQVKDFLAVLHQIIIVAVAVAVPLLQVLVEPQVEMVVLVEQQVSLAHQ
jgi:hypothetical protein